MTKSVVDRIVSYMRKADIVTKASPWMVEGFDDKELHVRYIGVRLDTEWTDLLSPQDNLLMKFIVGRNMAHIEYYLANNTPFIKIITREFDSTAKWETLLGDVKRRLRKDKSEFQDQTAQFNNVYARLKPHLK